MTALISIFSQVKKTVVMNGFHTIPFAILLHPQRRNSIQIYQRDCALKNKKRNLNLTKLIDMTPLRNAVLPSFLLTTTMPAVPPLGWVGAKPPGLWFISRIGLIPAAMPKVKQPWPPMRRSTHSLLHLIAAVVGLDGD